MKLVEAVRAFFWSRVNLPNPANAKKLSDDQRTDELQRRHDLVLERVRSMGIDIDVKPKQGANGY